VSEEREAAAGRVCGGSGAHSSRGIRSCDRQGVFGRKKTGVSVAGSQVKKRTTGALKKKKFRHACRNLAPTDHGLPKKPLSFRPKRSPSTQTSELNNDCHRALGTRQSKKETKERLLSPGNLIAGARETPARGTCCRGRPFTNDE